MIRRPFNWRCPRKLIVSDFIISRLLTLRLFLLSRRDYFSFCLLFFFNLKIRGHIFPGCSTLMRVITIARSMIILRFRSVSIRLSTLFIYF